MQDRSCVACVKFTLARAFRLDLALYARDQIRKILLRNNTTRTPAGLRAKLIRAAALFISRLCVFMVLICGANRLLFSPPSCRIDFVGLIYQTDFSARELFFEFDA